jgi:hypothetical protein
MPHFRLPSPWPFDAYATWTVGKCEFTETTTQQDPMIERSFVTAWRARAAHWLNELERRQQTSASARTRA